MSAKIGASQPPLSVRESIAGGRPRSQFRSASSWAALIALSLRLKIWEPPEKICTRGGNVLIVARALELLSAICATTTPHDRPRRSCSASNRFGGLSLKNQGAGRVFVVGGHP